MTRTGLRRGRCVPLLLAAVVSANLSCAGPGPDGPGPRRAAAPVETVPVDHHVHLLGSDSPVFDPCRTAELLVERVGLSVEEREAILDNVAPGLFER